MILIDLLVVLFLTILNGFFAMSELAVVNARRARLQVLADDGSRGARAAIDLASDPGRFLSSVQIGITLIGILAGASSGARLAEYLDHYLEQIPILSSVSGPLSLAVVVAGITFVSVIIGEIVPKQLALRNAEAVAATVSRPMKLVARFAAPLISLLDWTSSAVLRLIGVRPDQEQKVTDEEIKSLISEATQAGVVEHAEQQMIAGVMRLGDRPVRALMTPRPEVVWLDVTDPPQAIGSKLRETGYSRFPVCNGDLDDVIGVVQAKDLLDQALNGRPFDVGAAAHKAPIVLDAAKALQVLDVLKQSPLHMAIVVDEYGTVEGLVTAGDILGSIVGVLAEHGEAGEWQAHQRDDGSWLIDGGMPVDQVRDMFGLRHISSEGDYHTLAGFVLNQLGRIPKPGDSLEWQGYRFEVVDMDGRRIDKILLTRLEQPTGEESP
jgi:putative hemolysin